MKLPPIFDHYSLVVPLRFQSLDGFERPVVAQVPPTVLKPVWREPHAFAMKRLGFSV